MEKIFKTLDLGVKRIITSRSTDFISSDTKGFNLSKHANKELLFVLQGRSRYCLDGKVFTLTPGTMVMIDAWESHQNGYLQKDNTLIHLWLCFTPNRLYPCLLSVGKNGSHNTITDKVEIPNELYMFINNRWERLKQHSSPTQDLIKSFMLIPFNCILDEIQLQLQLFPSKVVYRTGSYSPIVEAIIRRIHQSNGRNCTYEQLEKALGYNRDYLARTFKKEMGCTIGNYISSYRYELTTLALSKGIKQKEIAEDLGFSSPSNFWNWLNKMRKSTL